MDGSIDQSPNKQEWSMTFYSEWKWLMGCFFWQAVAIIIMKYLGRSYAKLMINLRRHYRYLTKNVKFAAS